jgi:hypothetical protein
LLFIIPVILIFVTAFKCLKLFIAWQISIILMLQDFVHGRQYNSKEISASVSETMKTVYYVAQEKYKRLVLYGIGFTLLAKILAIPIPALSIETTMYSFMNWLVNISVIVLTIWQTLSCYWLNQSQLLPQNSMLLEHHLNFLMRIKQN